MGIKTITITTTTVSSNNWYAVEDLSNNAWIELIDVEYSDTDGNIIYLRDGSDVERYVYKSGPISEIDDLPQPYPIKCPIDYKDSDTGGDNTVILTVRDRMG